MGKIPNSNRFSGALEAIWPEAENSYRRTSRSRFTCRATCNFLVYLQEFCAFCEAWKFETAIRLSCMGQGLAGAEGRLRDDVEEVKALRARPRAELLFFEDWCEVFQSP